ncbi:MAG: M28 family peptidase [Flavobacteriaceae bacterium]|nr:M28 family peptidase [Flavobacteriaceae bacterium]
MTKLKIFSVFTILIAFLAFKNSEKILETFSTTYDPAKQDKAAPILFDENQQLEDLKYLSSDDFMGRATGHKGGLKARDFIVEKFQKLGLEKLNGSYIQSFDFKGKSHHDKPTEVTAHNVLGFIKGSKYPDQYIVLGAHYDHLGVKDGKIFNGADDNASGTCALFSLASYLKENQPKHSVIFAAWDAEELGLQGAKYFVENSIVGQDNLILNLNIDMIGRNANNELYICGSRYHEELKFDLVPAIQSNKIKLSTGHDGADGKDDWTFASDHGPFHKAGIPFLYFGVEDHPDYHRDTDEFSSINQDFYIEATKVLVRAFEKADIMYK